MSGRGSRRVIQDTVTCCVRTGESTTGRTCVARRVLRWGHGRTKTVSVCHVPVLISGYAGTVCKC
eukprot:1727455-Rhodomonas_salina.2